MTQQEMYVCPTCEGKHQIHEMTVREFVEKMESGEIRRDHRRAAVVVRLEKPSNEQPELCSLCRPAKHSSPYDELLQ